MESTDRRGIGLAGIGRSVRRFLVEAPTLPLLFIALVAFVALFGHLVTPYSPNSVDPINARMPPFWLEGGSWDHLFGTDRLGRDVFSRIIGGARVSLFVGITAVAVGGIVGSALGIAAGYWSGWVDILVMRLVDGFLAFPAILLALVFAVTIGPGFGVVVGVLALMLWARYARLVRGEVLALRRRDFVLLAKVAGASDLRIIFRHILPNVINTIVVLSTLQVGWAIVIEATLSFLGAGIPPPNPTWGGMVADGRDMLRSAWWVSVFPGAAIGLTVLSFNRFGDWTRDRLDPKLRQL